MSVFFNVYMLRFCARTVLQQARPNMMVMFAFEFAVLTILSSSTTARYVLSLYEAAVVNRQISQGRERLRHREGNLLSESEIADTEIDAAGWEEKGQWMFYLDIATDFFKLVLYLTFFCVLCAFYGMPIHIIRDVALTVRSFYKRVRDFVQYKQATRDMNARYPDATAEEISREDVCIICRENMTVWRDAMAQGRTGDSPAEHRPTDERLRAKRLPCGHLLHFACLRSWLERQQICPTCRTPVLSSNAAPPGTRTTVGPNVQGAHGIVNRQERGPHIYTLGPFRMIFGARQVNNNPQTNPAAAGVSGTPAPSVSQHRDTATLNSVNIQTQLSQIEQHIAREISNLSHLSGQLQVLRALQAEMTRLRVSHETPSSLTPTTDEHSRQILNTATQETLQSYRQVMLNHEHQDFPTGLILPHGWTLHALHRTPSTPVVSMNRTQQQPTPTELQGQATAGIATAHPRSSNSMQLQGSEGSLAPENPDVPEPMHFETPLQGEIDIPQPEDNATSLPEWGATAVSDGVKTVPPAGTSYKTESSQQKGKGRAATVEDDADDDR
ncbi:MAG: hypothetical protein LQ352_005845 [Teloschistes flavicans]|nr:MAG: hypothetical protein LQ352_005845 [Teloschistes flavicans]